MHGGDGGLLGACITAAQPCGSGGRERSNCDTKAGTHELFLAGVLKRAVRAQPLSGRTRASRADVYVLLTHITSHQLIHLFRTTVGRSFGILATT